MLDAKKQFYSSLIFESKPRDNFGSTQGMFVLTIKEETIVTLHFKQAFVALAYLVGVLDAKKQFYSSLIF